MFGLDAGGPENKETEYCGSSMDPKQRNQDPVGWRLGNFDTEFR